MRATAICALLVLIAAPLSPAQEAEVQEATDFVVGLNALNRQILQALQGQPTRRVIVLPFTDMQGAGSPLTTYIGEQLITALAADGGYQILDNRPLVELVAENRLTPLDLNSSAAYRLAAPQFAHTNIIVGVVTDIRTRVAVMARVLQGESGEYVGGAQVYLIAAEEVAMLRGETTRAPEAQPLETGPADVTAPEEIPVQLVEPSPEAAELEPVESAEPAGLEGRGEDSIYSQALDDYRAGRLAEAIGVFSYLVRVHPDSSLADNSLYWIGECYYGLERWDEALEGFRRVMRDYPYGDKVPAAMLKVAYTLERLGRNQEAINALEQLIARFADFPEAELGRQKLQLLRAQLQ